jgi:hypothetical protein
MALADGAGSKPARRGEKHRRIVRSVASWAVGSSEAYVSKDASLSSLRTLMTPFCRLARHCNGRVPGWCRDHAIVTVFARDVNSVAAAGEWDEQAGFRRQARPPERAVRKTPVLAISSGYALSGFRSPTSSTVAGERTTRSLQRW